MLTFSKFEQAPVMTAGNDVGSRCIVFEGHSEFSGDFVVEDVTCEGKLLRRLIFLNSPNVIQSEVELKNGMQLRKSLATFTLHVDICELLILCFNHNLRF